MMVVLWVSAENIYKVWMTFIIVRCARLRPCISFQ
jgi:hypothetical protein